MPNDSDITAFPKELFSFFDTPSGRSLLIKGGAGTGKTTFALQMLEEITDPDKCYYLTTRVSDDALYSQFPWLEEKEMHGRIVDAGRIFLKALYPSESEVKEGVGPIKDPQKLKSAKNFLKTIAKDERGPPTKVDRTRLSSLLEKIRVPEIEGIYDRIENILPERTTLVIDSVEGVTHKYGINAEAFITTLQKDLVENSNTNLILILEKASAPSLEFLVDGVLSLCMNELDGRRMRAMELQKLRATAIMQPNYLITLQDGRFKCLEPFCAREYSPRTWETKTDTPTHYSSGIPDLDFLLAGGFRKGSYNVIEISPKVSTEEYYCIVTPILLNFISQNRGIVAVLTGGDHAETTRSWLTTFIDSGQFDKHVRIADYFISTSDKPYIMALGTKNREDALKTWKENLAILRGPENKPILDYTGFDTLEHLRGDTIAIRDLLNAVAKIKITQDLGLGIIKPGLKIAQEIVNMSDTCFKIIDINGRPCIYGIKPKTMIYAITMNDERGAPYINLVPIV